MNWLKQNWIKTVIGGLVVVNVFLFANNKDAGLSNIALINETNSLTPTSTENPGLRGYSFLDAIDKADNQFKSAIRKQYPSRSLNYHESQPPYSRFGKDGYKTSVITEGYFIAFTKKFGPYKLEVLRYPTSYYEKGIIGDAYFEVLINGKKVASTQSEGDIQSDFTNLYELSFERKDYYFFQGWSGGVHCCTTLIPALFDGKTLQVGKALELGDYILMDDEDYSNDFFVKNSHLYWVTQESRFISNYGSMNQGTWVFPLVVYRLDGPNFVPAMSEFKELYDEEYKNMTIFIEGLKENAQFGTVIDQHKNSGEQGFLMTSDIADALVVLDRRFILGLYSNIDTQSLVDDYANDSKYFFGNKEPGGIEYLREILNGLTGKGSLIYNENNNLLNIAPERKI